MQKINRNIRYTNRIFAVLSVFIVLLLLASAIVIYYKPTEEKKEKKDIFYSIQEQIDKASLGDILHLSEGVYYENIIIDKPLTLIGETKGKTIIDGEGAEEIIFIKSDKVNLINLTIRNSGGYKGNSGIKIESCSNNIANCEIYRTKTGVYLKEAENNIISNCFFHTNGEGIYSVNSEQNLIEECQFCHNAFGINLEDSKNDTIDHSYIHTNGLGIYARNAIDTKIIYSAVCDNNQDGGGIWFFDCEKLEINNCNIDHNGAGIKLKNTDSTISHCNLHWNMYNTIKIKNSENTVISNCDIRNSYRTAVIIKESNCNFNNNNIVGSGLFGVKYEDYSCNARKNWWGSIFGPSYTELGSGDRITFKHKNLKLVPWSLKPVDNAGTDWDTKDVFTKFEVPFNRFSQIEFDGEDTDNDGCPDLWEEKWGYDPNSWDNHELLDPDFDGLNNIEECYTDSYGSSPFYKDIFLEVDWLGCKSPEFTNKPPDDLIEEMKNNFKKHDVKLHVDIGNIGNGEEMQYYNGLNPSDLRDLYWKYFLNNDLDNPRKGIFHYALILNNIEELYADYGGFVFFGWDSLDTIVLDAQRTQDWFKEIERGKIIVGGITHELGHTLGLLIDDHGGIDNDECPDVMRRSFWDYRNYKSCMNYLFKTGELLDYSDGTHGRGDFDDWGNLDFSFFKNTNFDHK